MDFPIIENSIKSGTYCSRPFVRILIGTTPKRFFSRSNWKIPVDGVCYNVYRLVSMINDFSMRKVNKYCCKWKNQMRKVLIFYALAPQHIPSVQGNIPKQWKRSITFAIWPMTNFRYFVANLCTFWCTFYILNNVAVC